MDWHAAGKRIPAEIQEERRRLFLRGDIPDRQCPACKGAGCLDIQRPLDRCPVCLGNQVVPKSLAEWCEGELTREEWRVSAQGHAPFGGKPGAMRGLDLEPERWVGERFGLAEERVYHMPQVA